jgi:hypothetical protein
MKEVVIKIPDPKFKFFMELMEQLGLEVFQRYDISEEQMNVVMERISLADSDPDRIQNWDDVKNKIGGDK